MEFKRKINTVRRSVMRTLTQGIGQTSNHSSKKIGPITNVRRVLICRPNHRLGNLLLITPLLKEISKEYPLCKIDLFVKGTAANEIFKNYAKVDLIIQLPKKPFKEPLQYLKCWLKLRKRNYDLVINADNISSSGRLSVKFSKSRFKLYGDALSEYVALTFMGFRHIAKAPVYDFRFATSKEKIFEWNDKVPNLDLKLDISELSNGRRILKKIAPEANKFITIFTYATGSKCHSVAWWEEFYEKLSTNFPNYTLIEILPAENVSQIGFKAKSFYSRDIREIASVIANTSIFIGADSGIMHLASASKVPVLGLFNVTKSEKYAPYNNYSIAIETNEDDIDDIIEIIQTTLYHRLDNRLDD